MFNQHKAGLDSVDKDLVNKVIEESSRGTPFWENQQRKDARHQERIRKVLERLDSASDQEWSKARAAADECLSQLELDMQRVIVHIDMDAFYASVEERDNPALKEKPMAVGCHSMLSTSNYVARRFGVRAGLPGFIALKLCPQLILVPPDMRKYAEASQKVMEVLSRYDPDLVMFGLDEAALNISELCRNSEKSPEEIVSEIRGEVRAATDLTCSAGIGPNQMVAKMFADVNKPDGQFRLETAGEIESFIRNLSVRKVFGIGQVQEKMLTALNVVKCSDFIEQRAKLFIVFNEATAKSYLAAAKGICLGLLDDSEGGEKRTRRSKSAETTFKDCGKLEFLTAVCQQLAERLAEDLQLGRLRGKLITVKFKTSSFDVFSRSVALEVATNSQSTIAEHATRILKSVLSRSPGIKFRLLGVKMSNFDDDGNSKRQATLSQLFRTTAMPVELKSESKLTTSTEVRETASPQPGPSESPSRTRSRSASPCSSEASLFEDESAVNVAVPSAPPPRMPLENRDTISDHGLGAPSTGDALIEETYCPVCAVIMRNVSEVKVNRHINECMDGEQRRDRLKRSIRNDIKTTPKKQNSLKGAKKRTTNSSSTHAKKKQVQAITSFFSK